MRAPRETPKTGVGVKRSEALVAALLEAKTLKDVENLGSQADLCSALNEVYHPFELSVDSYKDVLTAVNAIRSSLLNLKTYPFVNRQAEVIFSLDELDGKRRNKRLGVTDVMYEDKGLAKQWYRSIAQLIHSDKIGGDPRPIQELNSLYEKITHEPAADE